MAEGNSTVESESGTSAGDRKLDTRAEYRGPGPMGYGSWGEGWTQQTAGGQMPGIGPGRMAPDEERRKRREERIKTEEEGRKDKE